MMDAAPIESDKRECGHCYSILPEAFFIECSRCGILLCLGCEAGHLCKEEEKIGSALDYGGGKACQRVKRQSISSWNKRAVM